MKKEEINKCINMLISEDLEIRRLAFNIVDQNLDINIAYNSRWDKNHTLHYYKTNSKRGYSFKNCLEFITEAALATNYPEDNMPILNLLYQCPQKTKE